MDPHDPNSLVHRVADWVIDRRFVALGLIALLAGASMAGVFVRGLRADFSPQALFTTFEDQAAIDAAFVERFGQTENVVLIAVGADDVLQEHVLSYIHEISTGIEGDFIGRIESITLTPIPRAGGPGELIVNSPIRGDSVEADEVAELREALQTSRLLTGQLIDADWELAVVAVFLAQGYENIDAMKPAYLSIEETVLALDRPDGVELVFAGLPSIRVYVVDQMLGDQFRLIPIAIVVCGLMLLLAFRWFPAIFVPNFAVGIAIIMLVGGMAVVGEPFNIINQVLPTLLLIIGVSDSIHLLSRYGEEFAVLQDKASAAKRTLSTMAVACFLTSFTTAVGFGSLLISSTEILRRFGFAASIGVMLAYFATVLVLPPILTVAPKPRGMLGTVRDGVIERVCVLVTRWVLRHPHWTLTSSGIVLVAIVIAATMMRIDTQLLETFPEGSEVYDQVHLLEDELDGLLPVEVYLHSETQGRFDDPELLTRIESVSEWLRGYDGVLSVTSYPDHLRETWVAYSGDESKWDEPWRSEAQIAQLASLLEGGNPDPIAPYVTPDRRHFRLNVQVADYGSKWTMRLADEIEERLTEELDGIEDVTFEMTGDAYSGSIGLDSLVKDMFGSVMTAFVIIFGFMALLFGSLRIGLISVPPNMIPLLLTMAYMGLRGINLNTTTVIVFSISIGLAVDDTIHMLARYREERQQGASLDEALILAARGSGRAIVVTSIMLVAGMAVMLNSSFMPIRWFGELISVTIAGCLFGDLLVLPALLKVFGDGMQEDDDGTPA